MIRLDRSSALLAVGSTLGLLLAAGSLLASGRSPGHALPPDTVARVNGVPIRAEDYRRALDAVAGDRRDDPDAAMRHHVLDRMIDEELLVQRGLELGLARVDPRVRRELAAAVVTEAVTEGTGGEPTADDLRALYEAERGFFARGGRLQVRQVFVAATTPDAERRARDAAARLRAGGDPASVRQALGDPEPAPVPDTMLTLAKLSEYVGPTAARTALALAPGAVSDPVRSSAGFHVLLLVQRDEETVPPLADIEDEVREEWRRRGGEHALRAQLDDLRSHASVEVTTEP
jgi:parvulin-like peptidyl-prolyl cis-trans isomerase-like protein/SurA-like protein